MNIVKKIVIWILTLEARLVLWRYRPKIIAVTGSVGKTSTKDAIFAGLSKKVFIRKSEKSFNSDLGVPLTILGLESGWRNPLHWAYNICAGAWCVAVRQKYPEYLVLEVGADRPGDIARIARWLRPHVAVITSVPEVPAHVEYFESAEHVLREKRSLADYLVPEGKLVLSGDDERVRALLGEFRGIAVTYGISDAHDYSSSHEEITYEDGKPVGMHFRVNHEGSSVPVVLKESLGTPRIYAALAACAVGSVFGVDMLSIAEGLSEYICAPGRMRLVEGKNGSMIIDDTYNSSPHAARAALDTLGAVQGAKRRVALLGDMLELGRTSAEAHRAVGAHAARSCGALVTVGIRARGFAEGAMASGMKEAKITQYEAGEAARAGEELSSHLKPGDVILVKGSQGMRMERAVKALMAHPEDAHTLLVRQDDEWLARY